MFLWDFRRLPFFPPEGAAKTAKAKNAATESRTARSSSPTSPGGASREGHLSWVLGEKAAFWPPLHEGLKASAVSPQRLARAWQLLLAASAAEQPESASEEEEGEAWLLLFLLGDKRPAARRAVAAALFAASKSVRDAKARQFLLCAGLAGFRACVLFKDALCVARRKRLAESARNSLSGWRFSGWKASAPRFAGDNGDFHGKTPKTPKTLLPPTP